MSITEDYENQSSGIVGICLVAVVVIIIGWLALKLDEGSGRGWPILYYEPEEQETTP